MKVGGSSRCRIVIGDQLKHLEILAQSGIALSPLQVLFGLFQVLLDVGHLVCFAQLLPITSATALLGNLSRLALALDIRLLFADTRQERSMAMALTKRQRQVYDFIAGFVQSNGYSPSFEEIGEALGLSSLATVHKHISNLEEKGFLRRGYNRSRSIDVLPSRGRLRQAVAAASGWPLVGRIAAGRPMEAIEHPETISLNDFSRSKEVFVLQVRGDSMQDEHIVDGDYVLVEKAATAHNGDIVVALVSGNEATLKRFYKEGDRVRLQPSNAAMQPIIVPARDVRLQGRVVGVLRKY
jgi:repressor LexA